MIRRPHWSWTADQRRALADLETHTIIWMEDHGDLFPHIQDTLAGVLDEIDKERTRDRT